MTPINSVSNEETRLVSFQDLEKKQEQINSLAVNLGQILDSLEEQKSKGNSDTSSLYTATQESIKYLGVLINNIDFVKRQTDMIVPGFAVINDTMEHHRQNIKDNLVAVDENLKILQKEQLRLQKTLIDINKSPALQWRNMYDMLDWKTLLISVFSILSFGFFASVMGSSMVSSRNNDDNIEIRKEITRIQEYLGIKNGKNNKSKK
jgi:hypothetical protein